MILCGRHLDNKIDDTMIKSLIEKSVALFDFITDKDMFQDMHRNCLAKRLLDGKNASDDAERYILTLLKQKCGANFTYKMEEMLNDLDTSKALVATYPYDKTRNMGVRLDPYILTHGYWVQFCQLPNIKVPIEMTGAFEHFTKWYTDHSAYSTRKLMVIYSQGIADIDAKFIEGSKLLTVSTTQAIILLAFNTKKTWVASELATHLCVPLDIFKRIIHPLYSVKGMNILNKEPKGAKIDDGDVFTYNASFKNPKKKLTLPRVKLEPTLNKASVDEGRKHAVDACIVRIMKARSTLAHADLILEVINQIRLFQVQPRLIKDRIQTLIEGNYLERDEENTNVYNYLA
jgi:cullin 1